MKTVREAYLFLGLLRGHRGQSWMAISDNRGANREGYFFCGVELRNGNICLPLPMKYINEARTATLNTLLRAPVPVTDSKEVIKILKDTIK